MKVRTYKLKLSNNKLRKSSNLAQSIDFFSELNFCDQNPRTCLNGGKCTSMTADDGAFKCECPTGFKGKKCEIIPILPSAATTTISTSEPTHSDDTAQVDNDDDDDDKDATTESNTDSQTAADEIDNEA